MRRLSVVSDLQVVFIWAPISCCPEAMVPRGAQGAGSSISILMRRSRVRLLHFRPPILIEGQTPPDRPLLRRHLALAKRRPALPRQPRRGAKVHRSDAVRTTVNCRLGSRWSIEVLAALAFGERSTNGRFTPVRRLASPRISCAINPSLLRCRILPELIEGQRLQAVIDGFSPALHPIERGVRVGPAPRSHGGHQAEPPRSWVVLVLRPLDHGSMGERGPTPERVSEAASPRRRKR